MSCLIDKHGVYRNVEKRRKEAHNGDGNVAGAGSGRS